ncbi:MAG TPA: 30S ribosome-binding factor RbfA [Thermoanaerobaculia bacterium]|jgi:ribosome-binding factor A
MRKTRRTSKVGEVIRDALVDVFRHDLKHMSLGLASITGVDVSPDLHFARVFISGFKEDETREKVKELQDARGRIRGFLGKRIHLRYTPELDFKYDETTMRASRIEELLTQVRHDDDDHEPES